MTGHHTLIRALPLLIFLSIASAPTSADIFDDPKNLKVLPEDISPVLLRDTMRSFTADTGSRCSTCHVGDSEFDLRTYDFSLDDKDKKIKAREMIAMVNDINERLDEVFDGSPNNRLIVNCATCHHGQARPETIQQVLAGVYNEVGLDKALEKYRSLRERYYGSYTFDFSERALLLLADDMATSGDSAGALGFLDFNLQLYPQSGNSYVLQGRLHADNGDVAAARASLESALQIDPDDGRAIRLMSELPDE